MMAVTVNNPGDRFDFTPAKLLFESRYQHGGQPPSYDVAADGRFVMIKPTDARVSSFNIVLNWAAAAAQPRAH